MITSREHSKNKVHDVAGCGGVVHVDRKWNQVLQLNNIFNDSIKETL